jgi:hypothetical protein
MNLNRKRVLAGLAVAGITVGTLAGGGVAVASTGPAHAPATTSQACGHHHGMWSHPNGALTAVAGYLGLNADQLRSQLESGKSLADVAHAQGKPVSGLKDTILGSLTKQINSATWLSPAQKSALISDVKGHLSDIVYATCTSGTPPGGPSWSPSGSPGGSGSPSGSPSWTRTGP